MAASGSGAVVSLLGSCLMVMSESSERGRLREGLGLLVTVVVGAVFFSSSASRVGESGVLDVKDFMVLFGAFSMTVLHRRHVMSTFQWRSCCPFRFWVTVKRFLLASGTSSCALYAPGTALATFLPTLFFAVCATLMASCSIQCAWSHPKHAEH